jgi:F1F0 ATPase subunit 2
MIELPVTSLSLPLAGVALPLAGMACGLGLGMLYFGGLYLTLKRLPGSRQPALLAYGSFAARSLVCLLGFYLISRSGLVGLIGSIVGFVLMKLALVSRIGGVEAN